MSWPQWNSLPLQTPALHEQNGLPPYSEAGPSEHGAWPGHASGAPGFYREHNAQDPRPAYRQQLTAQEGVGA
jgi:hypothetical protein